MYTEATSARPSAVPVNSMLPSQRLYRLDVALQQQNLVISWPAQGACCGRAGQSPEVTAEAPWSVDMNTSLAHQASIRSAPLSCQMCVAPGEHTSTDALQVALKWSPGIVLLTSLMSSHTAARQQN